MILMLWMLVLLYKTVAITAINMFFISIRLMGTGDEHGIRFWDAFMILLLVYGVSTIVLIHLDILHFR